MMVLMPDIGRWAAVERPSSQGRARRRSPDPDDEAFRSEI
jgi:hypothetical protein